MISRIPMAIQRQCSLNRPTRSWTLRLQAGPPACTACTTECTIPTNPHLQHSSKARVQPARHPLSRTHHPMVDINWMLSICDARGFSRFSLANWAERLPDSRTPFSALRQPARGLGSIVLNVRLGALAVDQPLGQGKLVSGIRIHHNELAWSLAHAATTLLTVRIRVSVVGPARSPHGAQKRNRMETDRVLFGNSKLGGLFFNENIIFQ